jgi:hypothetical protein
MSPEEKNIFSILGLRAFSSGCSIFHIILN